MFLQAADIIGLQMSCWFHGKKWSPMVVTICNCRWWIWLSILSCLLAVHASSERHMLTDFPHSSMRLLLLSFCRSSLYHPGIFILFIFFFLVTFFTMSFEEQRFYILAWTKLIFFFLVFVLFLAPYFGNSSQPEVHKHIFSIFSSQSFKVMPLILKDLNPSRVIMIHGRR